MFNTFLTIIKHEVLLTWRSAHAWLTPLLFFGMVVCLFPLTLGPDADILKKMAPGMIWIAAVLATLLSIENIFRADAEAGFLDLLLLSPQPLTFLLLAKIVSHWLVYGLPLVMLSPILGMLLQLSPDACLTLFFSLLLGTPVLSMMGAIGAALTVNLRQQSLLLPVLILPLYIPVLIFGTQAVMSASSNLPVSADLALMAALSLLSVAFAPLFTSLALRTGANQ
jgi:heme exporter protein B